MPSISLSCQPEDLAMLQDVYKRILRESWFARTELNERDFAKVIVRLFQQGIADEERLFVEALAVARTRFCNEGKALETSQSS